VEFEFKLVIQIEAQSPVCWIELGKEQLRVSVWLTDQMGYKIACWKAEILSFKRVGCAGNYPLYISLQKINKIGLAHG